MKDIDTKEKFITLRARGYSFDKISDQLNISKPTLIKWNSELSKEIANFRFFAAEKLLERYHLMKTARLETFSKILNSSLEELQKRPLNQLTNKELLSLINYLETRLTKEARSINYTTTETISSWNALDPQHVTIPLLE